MALSVPERAAQIAEHFAAHSAHGYSQPNRGAGGYESITLTDGSTVRITAKDVDCSEMVRQCVNGALGKVAIASMWTGDQDEKLRAQGFTRLAFTRSTVKRGDVLLRAGHTAIATSPYKQAEACHDEYGSITGPTAGDQTGTEVAVNSLSSNWTYIYRYPTVEVAQRVEATFDWKFDRAVRVRKAPSTKAEALSAKWASGDVMHADGFWVADGCTWGTYIGPSTGLRLYAAMTQDGTAYGEMV